MFLLLSGLLLFLVSLGCFLNLPWMVLVGMDTFGVLYGFGSSNGRRRWYGIPSFLLICSLLLPLYSLSERVP